MNEAIVNHGLWVIMLYNLGLPTVTKHFLLWGVLIMGRSGRAGVRTGNIWKPEMPKNEVFKQNVQMRKGLI